VDGDVGPGDTLHTAPGSRAIVALANGVSLRLDEGSDVVLLAAGRLSLPSGTLYLDAGPADATEATVRVTTPLGEVWDVGTQFEVRSDPQRLRIRVREGVVHYESGPRSLVSTAGEELLIPAHGQAVRSQISAHDPAWDWVSELARFQGAGDYTAATLLAWVARETGRPVRFDSPATRAHAEALRLHGAQGLSPRETLDVVAATTDLRCELAPAAIIVRVAAR
jgi:ferric-dicitrate binding protein FerR (iron transport regulator)